MYLVIRLSEDIGMHYDIDLDEEDDIYTGLLIKINTIKRSQSWIYGTSDTSAKKMMIKNILYV